MKMLLLGDVCPISSNELFEQRNIDSLFSQGIRNLFNQNEIKFVNLECALTDSESPIEKFGRPLKATPITAEILREIGVNYCGLSNNHIFDYGIQGALDTMRYLDESGIHYTGFGMNYDDSRKNLVINCSGENVCVITVCEHEYSYALEERMGSRAFDVFDTMEDIREASKKYNRVIVCYHGGKEFSPYPSPRLVQTCRAMAKNGADVVLCQHSHCIGCYEEYENCHILYGQGNFHFYKENVSASWNESLSVEYDSLTHKIKFIPTIMKGCCVTLAEGVEKEKILEAFEDRSKQLKNGLWREGWHDYCMTVREQYLYLIGRVCAPDSKKRENDVLGHYIDCEAHLDVLRELFPTANMTNEREGSAL